MLDTVIRGGTVVDGTRKAPYSADLGIAGDRIVAIGNLGEASDGWTSSETAPVGKLQNTPASFGWVPRFVAQYSRDQWVLPLEETIRKMTGMAAEKFEIDGRGVLAVGKYADIAVSTLTGWRSEGRSRTRATTAPA